MGATGASRCVSCNCEDQADQVNTMTLDSLADGMINLQEVPTAGTQDYIMSKHELTGKVKKPDILRFKVSLYKEPGQNFGLAHMPMEDGSKSLLIVEHRPDTPIARYNMEQRSLGKTDNEVKHGDRIVAVGDGNKEVSDIDGMREMLRKDSIEFTVERWPQTITIVLKKSDPNDKYGMQTDLIIRDDGSKVLRVGRISGGLLGEWNALAAGARRFFDIVGQFSEIVQVNEQKSDPERMQQMLVSEQEVEVAFIRPDPELYNH